MGNGWSIKNRIQKEDLHQFVQSRLSETAQGNRFEFSQPDIDYSKWGLIKEEKLSKFQKSSISNLHTSWINIPHVTQHDECDLNILLEVRTKLCKKHKVKKKETVQKSTVCTVVAVVLVCRGAGE